MKGLKLQLSPNPTLLLKPTTGSYLRNADKFIIQIYTDQSKVGNSIFFVYV